VKSVTINPGLLITKEGFHMFRSRNFVLIPLVALLLSGCSKGPSDRVVLADFLANQNEVDLAFFGLNSWERLNGFTQDNNKYVVEGVFYIKAEMDYSDAMEYAYRIGGTLGTLQVNALAQNIGPWEEGDVVPMPTGATFVDSEQGWIAIDYELIQ
jgi:hypothetical protein